jgi:hypothetical protein
MGTIMRIWQYPEIHNELMHLILRQMDIIQFWESVSARTRRFNDATHSGAMQVGLNVAQICFRSRG